MSDAMPQLTERARRVLTFAQEAANQSGSAAIDAEHLVQGLQREGAAVADTADLKSMGRDVEAYMDAVVYNLMGQLAGIRGYADLLRSDELKPETRQRAFEAIATFADEMIETINGMKPSWMIAPKIILGPGQQECDLKVIVGKAMSDLEGKATNKSVLIQFDLSAVDGLIRGDENRLYRMARHLVADAIKYSPDGAQVKIGLTRDTSGIWLRVQNQVLVIPEGAFIIPVKTPIVTGYNTFIVKAIAEAYGGTVEARNLPTGGVEFVVLFPAAIVLPPEN